jgi:hypothetical protein
MGEDGRLPEGRGLFNLFRGMTARGLSHRKFPFQPVEHLQSGFLPIDEGAAPVDLGDDNAASRFRHLRQKGESPHAVPPEEDILHDHQAKSSQPGVQNFGPSFQQDGVVDLPPFRIPHGFGQPIRFWVCDQDRFEVSGEGQKGSGTAPQGQQSPASVEAKVPAQLFEKSPGKIGNAEGTCALQCIEQRVLSLAKVVHLGSPHQGFH